MRSSYSKTFLWWALSSVCLFFVVPGSKVVGNPERTSDEGAMAREMDFNSDQLTPCVSRMEERRR